MEDLNDRISSFLTTSGYGSKDGRGDGSGDGRGDGRGDGSGNANGYGSRIGSGDGGGSRIGSGDGYGSGNACGDGSGDGSGCGSGYGYGLKTYEKQTVHYIDGVATVIRTALKNVARGYVINSDLTTQDCVIVRSGNLFAHGDTFADAQAALQEKLFDGMDVGEKIELFREKFDDGVKYPAREFYDWHHRLTGSCEFGRKSFAREHEIDLDAGVYTVREFVAITEHAYGGEIIGRLKEYYTE